MARIGTRLLGIWMVVLLAAGCSLLNQPTPDGGGGGGGGTFGYGTPTLALTINGVHFGPDVPLAGSGVDLTTTRDSLTDHISDTKLIIGAQTAAGAACQLAFDRFGDDVSPFHANAGYMITGMGVTATPDGAVTPLGAQTVSVPQGAWSCGGSDCEGSVLLLTVIAADHFEGTVSGNFPNTGGAGDASVVCSFYLPTRSYQP
jgi:hypothetical protein